MALPGSFGRVPAIIAEATRKSDLVWIGSEDAMTTPAWHLWHGDSAYVVTGPGEQPLPAISDLPTATVTVRSKDNLNRVVTWEALVWRLKPDTDDWAEIVPLLIAKRLNLPDAEGAAQRWARDCTVIRLEPTGRLSEAGATMPTDSGAEPPRRTPATTSVRVPFTLGRRRRV